jgi:hypothetical protein
MHSTRPKHFEFTEKQSADLQTMLLKQKLNPGELLLESPEGRKFIASATSVGRDTYKSASGHLYRVEYRDGNAVVTRDDKLTEEAQLVMQAQAEGSAPKVASASATLGSLTVGTQVVYRPANERYRVAGSKIASYVHLENPRIGTQAHVAVNTPVDVIGDDLMSEWAVV